MTPRPRIGVSRCLLGDTVRHDGGHKADRFLLHTLAAHVEWVPVCPELEVGMGVPREAVHLTPVPDEGSRAAAKESPLRLVGVRTGTDWTGRMVSYAGKRATALAREDLSGFILKKDSPSCGLERVRVHHGPGHVTRTGRGLFADALVRRHPFLPIEEEGRLIDAGLRENFIERVFAYWQLTRFFRTSWTVRSLVAFHTSYKLQLLAHSRPHYERLGRLVAGARRLGRQDLSSQYRAGFMEALAVMATKGRNADVMLHMLGHLKKELPSPEKQELLDLVSDYRSGIVPLVVPLTLFRHHVRVREIEYLQGQTYLEPHPRELALRNHA